MRKQKKLLLHFVVLYCAKRDTSTSYNGKCPLNFKVSNNPKSDNPVYTTSRPGLRMTFTRKYVRKRVRNTVVTGDWENNNINLGIKRVCCYQLNTNTALAGCICL